VPSDTVIDVPGEIAVFPRQWNVNTPDLAAPWENRRIPYGKSANQVKSRKHMETHRPFGVWWNWWNFIKNDGQLIWPSGWANPFRQATLRSSAEQTCTSVKTSWTFSFHSLLTLSNVDPNMNAIYKDQYIQSHRIICIYIYWINNKDINK
jgi:hypothetical protein